MLKSDEAHFEFAFGPDDFARGPEVRSRRQEVDDRLGRSIPAVFLFRRALPSRGFEDVREAAETVQIERDREVDITGQASEVPQLNQDRCGPDDDEISVHRLTDSVDLHQVGQLLWCQEVRH
jgi:hypothetical protein